MKRGFTLIELLGVITLIGILALVVVPETGNIMKKTKNKAYNTQLESMKKSLKEWGAKNVMKLPSQEGEYVEIDLGTLKQEGLIDKDFKDPRNKKCFDNDTVLRITKKNNNYSYTIEGEIKTTDTCELDD